MPVFDAASKPEKESLGSPKGYRRLVVQVSVGLAGEKPASGMSVQASVVRHNSVELGLVEEVDVRLSHASVRSRSC